MNHYTGLEIAIIGMNGRFPGAADIETYWNNIRNGVESVSFFTDEELLAEGEDPEKLKNPLYVRANAFLKDKEFFDSAFFKYLPDEAAMMDPQMRILHECVWQAIEDAGYDVNTYRNRIGLFTGATPNLNWENYTLLKNNSGVMDDFSAILLRNAAHSNTRVSYALNLRGPSVFLTTACSTSLVAVHNACNSLLLGECTIAVAGGVSINNISKRGYVYQDGMIISRDGHCRPFDKDASGTVPGEGVGVVVLKRLKQALEDKDNILAIIKGTGVNNDGNEKVGYTAPGVDGQTEAILMARRMAKVSAESISYVEAHGTGTRLGDPIEVEALNRAFGNNRVKYCALGSVKSNIGHLDAAAGVAGLIKTVLALKHRQLPPSLHYTAANPKIDFDNGPFYVNTELKEWRNEGHPLRAGVSSFGIGGTNAHVILEEAPAPVAVTVGRDQQLLLLSGKNVAALERNTRQLLAYLKKEEIPALADVAYTLHVGRAALDYRRSIVCADRAEAIQLLETPFAAEGVKSHPQVVFMFSGQGAQYINMCRGLYEKEKVFRQEADRCFDWVQQRTGRDLRSVIFTEEDGGIDQTSVTQPALFIVEYALCRQLLSWGIKPDRMIGHSIGEYVAACIGGLFTLEDALDLVVTRGRLMQQAPAGSMAAVSMSEESLRAVLATHPGLSIAAVNSSELCVVSGDKSSVARFEEVMTAEGHRVRVLRTSHAFHCYLMDGILEEFGQAVSKVKMGELTIPLVSNLTGDVVSSEQVRDPKYWVDHLRQAVLFSKGIEGLLKTSANVVFVEVGPGRMLSTLVRAHKEKGEGHVVVSLVRPVQDDTADGAVLLKGLGELWMNGIAVDWAMLYEGQTRKRVSLPAYVFERTSYPVLVDAYKMIGDLVSENVREGDWYYAPSWHRRVLPGGGSVRPVGKTLILCDETGVGRALGVKLEGQGEEVIYVENEEVYEGLSSVSRVISARGIQGEELSRDQASELYFYSLTRLVRAAQEQGGLAGKEIVVVTSDLYPIVGGEAGSPYKALSQGMLKVLSQENPGLITSHIDITLSESVNIDALAAELLVREKGKIVGYRNGRRWVQTIERLSIDGDKKPGSRICSGGLYVVTGGLGKLGYELSRYLLGVYKARVVLLGRKGLPLDAERGARLEGLERMGDVMYLACDISDADALRQVVEKIEGQWGRINGVIHAAAVTSGRSINGMTPVQELTVADYMLQFSPKIEGLEALKEVLGDRDLDFCLLTSSLSAILGGLGFGAYASANVYMDAFIQGHRDRGQLVNWVSINFDGLHFSDEKDLHNLNNTDIRKVVETVLSITDHPQVVVSKGDLHRRIREWVSGEEEGVEMAGKEAVTVDKGLGDDVVGGQGFSGTATERKLLGLWQDFFGRETIGLDSDFFEIGGDSLKALSIIGRINKALHIQLPVTEFFKRSTIRKLGEYITATGPVPETKALPEEKNEEMELPFVSDEMITETDDGINEIQHLLLQHPRLRDVLVFKHDYKHKGTFRLAFVVPDGIISTDKLKTYLADRLSADNMPDYIIKADSLFVNGEGKANRKLLARLAYMGTIGADLYVEPKTELDKQVSMLWREVTGAPRVSLNDTFFDIGGTIGQLEALSKLISRKFSVELPQSLYYTLSLQQVTARLSKAVKPEAVKPEAVAVKPAFVNF